MEDHITVRIKGFNFGDRDSTVSRLMSNTAVENSGLVEFETLFLNRSSYEFRLL